jgi:DNA-binding response OmpR family regulator
VARLLFVDDEIQLLYMVSAYFHALGYEVAVAQDVNEAECLIAEEEYALVVSDLELCDPLQRRGFELLREVRRRNARARTILLTAFGCPDARRQALEMGVDLVLDKPQPLKKLADIVARMLGPQTPHDSLSQKGSC